MAHESPYGGPIPSRLFKEDLMDGVKELDMVRVKEMMRAKAMYRYRNNRKNDLEKIHEFGDRLVFEYGMEKALLINDQGTRPLFDVTILSTLTDPLDAIRPVERRDHVLLHKEM